MSSRETQITRTERVHLLLWAVLGRLQQQTSEPSEVTVDTETMIIFGSY
ncbi:MAG: hypothetical protein Q6356_009735 [Candidatus Wukongarchaeota archaeon]|nr:hypothetical protein [Candidatus Wukongarchaeota archaeon]